MDVIHNTSVNSLIIKLVTNNLDFKDIGGSMALGHPTVVHF